MLCVLRSTAAASSGLLDRATSRAETQCGVAPQRCAIPVTLVEAGHQYPTSVEDDWDEAAAQLQAAYSKLENIERLERDTSHNFAELSRS